MIRRFCTARGWARRQSDRLGLADLLTERFGDSVVGRRTVMRRGLIGEHLGHSYSKRIP